jgi:lipopolysaccharide export system permease protein
MGQWILPTTVSASNKIWHEEVDKKTSMGLIVRNGRVYYRGIEGFYSFDVRAIMSENEYFNLSYATWDTDYQLDVLLNAKVAKWQQGKWDLRKGYLQKRTKEGDYSVTFFDKISYELPEDPSHLFIPEHKFAERSISELFSRARLTDDIHANIEWLEFHKKVSYNTLGLPLLLLGLPMLLIIHQRWGRDLSIAVPGSCVLAFLVWMWWGAFQTMAKNSLLNPAIASWSIHILVGFLGIILLRQKEL